MLRHDGVDWTPLGTGVDDIVDAITSIGSDLYVGGRFTNAGGVAASRIAKWNGANWSPVGRGISGSEGGTPSVSTLTSIGDNLYVGGNFTNAGGVNVNRLTRWDGLKWFGLGSGVERSDSRGASVSALGARGNDLFAVGDFTVASGKPSFFVAHWNDQINFDSRPRLLLGQAQYLANGQFRCSVTAEGMSSYVVEGSTDLLDWDPLATNVIGTTAFEDARGLAFPRRFYRARPGP